MYYNAFFFQCNQFKDCHSKVLKIMKEKSAFLTVPNQIKGIFRNSYYFFIPPIEVVVIIKFDDGL